MAREVRIVLPIDTEDGRVRAELVLRVEGRWRPGTLEDPPEQPDVEVVAATVAGAPYAGSPDDLAEIHRDLILEAVEAVEGAWTR